MISKNEVKKVASLSRLTLSDSEVDHLAEDMNRILGYVELLSELDLSDIKPTAHAVETENVFREDEAKKSDVIQKVLEHAPEHDDNFFLVPKIIS